MSKAIRAAIGGAVLAFALAPAADAAKPTAKLSVTRVGTPPASAVAGSTFQTTARVANARGRRASSGRLTLSLQPTTGRKVYVSGFNVKRLKSGSARTLRLRVKLPLMTPAGAYRLRVCVRRGSGEGKARCRTAGRIAITRPVVPATPATPAAPARQNDTPDSLKQAVTAEGMASHLRAWQRVADENGGNRASGLQGFGGSMEYLLTTLRGAGYQPTVQVFDFPFFKQLEPSTFVRNTPTPRTYVENTDFAIMSFSGSGDTTAPLRPVDVNLTPPRASTSGCEAADFANFPRGAIALMQRGSCDFGVKVANAETAGASGAIIFNQGNTDTADRNDLFAGTLGRAVGIPAISVSYAYGAELVNQANGTGGSTARIRTKTQNDTRRTANVIAETAGNPNEVVMLGSHLDSVPEGPGINDNGTGSAFNLELALQMAKMNPPLNRVRFAWWGAEEEGLLGSTHYVADITEADFERIQLNLNFDMLGSPNHAVFVYDGDFSNSTPPQTAPDLNPGAAQIERAFNDYFTSQGIPFEPTAFDGRSDYKAFQDNGKPAGGLFSGAEVPKTAAQAAKWGGIPGRPFDPNYHQAGDTISNVDFVGYEKMADAAAYVTGLYATGQLNARTATAGGGARARDVRAAGRAAQGEWRGSRLAS